MTHETVGNSKDVLKPDSFASASASTPHPDLQTLETFVTGRLQRAESESVVRHLESCQPCSETVNAISNSRDPLDTMTSPQAVNDNGVLTTNAGQDEFATQGSPTNDTPEEGRADDPQQTHFGRYRIERLLGRGGFGKVFKAWDDQLRRPVAIKVTFQKFLDLDNTEAYLAEARTVASLDHPHIVPVYDIGQSETGDYYVVSKLIEGKDLAKRISAQRPSHSETISIVASIAEALHHAHSKGLVHRDVKPANILIDVQERAFLTDFGIALREDDFGRSQGLAGTPNYMSPEQARGEGHRVDGRSDLYSLGVVLYELLTGRRPFQSDKPLDLLLKIAENEVRPPRQFDESIPRELERICLKALALRASDRYLTGIDFAEDLRFLAAQDSPDKRKQNSLSEPERQREITPVNSSISEATAPPTPTPTGPT